MLSLALCIVLRPEARQRLVLCKYSCSLALVTFRTKSSNLWSLNESRSAYEHIVWKLHPAQLAFCCNPCELGISSHFACAVRTLSGADWNMIIELCLWIYTIYPLLQGQSSTGLVDKSVWPTFRRPRFKSWLDLNIIFCHYVIHNVFIVITTLIQTNSLYPHPEAVKCLEGPLLSLGLPISVLTGSIGFRVCRSVHNSRKNNCGYLTYVARNSGKLRMYHSWYVSMWSIAIIRRSCVKTEDWMAAVCGLHMSNSQQVYNWMKSFCFWKQKMEKLNPVRLVVNLCIPPHSPPFPPPTPNVVPNLKKKTQCIVPVNRNSYYVSIIIWEEW